MAGRSANCRVRGTDDCLTEPAANPHTERISPNLTGPPSRHPIAYFRANMNMALLVSQIESDRPRKVMTKSPLLACLDRSAAKHGFGDRQPQFPVEQQYFPSQLPLYGQNQISHEIDSDRRISGPNVSLARNKGTFPRSIKARPPFYGPRSASKIGISLKGEDRLTEARVAKVVYGTYPKEYASLPQISIYNTVGGSLANGIQNFSESQVEEQISKFEAPCKVLRRLSSELSQKARRRHQGSAREVPCLSTAEKISALKPMWKLKDLPAVRLLPPCLAGAQLSEQGVEYALRPVSATWATRCHTYREWSPLGLGDTTSEKGGNGASPSKALWEDPTTKGICGLVDDHNEAGGSFIALLWSTALLMVVISVFQAVTYTWNMFLDNGYFCGQLCWFFPD